MRFRLSSAAVVATALFLSATIQFCAQAESPDPSAWCADYRKRGGSADFQQDKRSTLLVTKQEHHPPVPTLIELRPPAGVRAVKLQGYGVEDDDLLALKTWKGLETVEVLDGKSVTDCGVRGLGDIRTLRTLVLMETAVTGDGLAALSGHPALARLEVGNTVIDGRVRELDLTDLPRLERLALNCGGLRRLTLARMPTLREVERLPASPVTAELARLGRLTELDFHASALAALSIKGCPALETLDARRTELSGLAVGKLRAALPGVRVRR